MSSKVSMSAEYRRVGNKDARQVPRSPKSMTGLKNYDMLIYMLSSLVVGLLFAVAHHLSYAHFDGMKIDEASLDQVWLVRIGTGLAFLSKTFLIVSTAIAYTQQQWLWTRNRALKIKHLDKVTGILANPLGFASQAWLHVPVPGLLALVAWLLPIAAIITPATISVVLHEEVSSSLGTPRQLYYDPSTYASLGQYQAQYLAPSPNLLRATYGSALTGRVSEIPVSSPNMSYILEYIGPALKCDPADGDLIDKVYDAYLEIAKGIENDYDYFSWVPIRSGRTNISDFDSTLDVTSTDAAHIYVIPSTASTGPIFIGGIEFGGNGPWGYQDLIDCKLYNASYQVSFNYSYPAQRVNVLKRDFLNPVNAIVDIDEYYRPGDATEYERNAQIQRISYQSIMDVLGRLLVGTEWSRDLFNASEKTSRALLSVDWTTRQGAISGIEEVFQNMTFSALSSESLIMNATIAEQNQVLISISSMYNIYRYNSEDLWATYGIAIALTTICAALGAYTMLWTGSAYSNIFSSYIRAVARKEVLLTIDVSDKGAEPLPRSLAETVIKLG